MSREDFLVGVHAIEAALQHDPPRVLELWVMGNQPNARVAALARQAQALGLLVHSCAADELDRMTGHLKHQGIAASYRKSKALPEEDLLRDLESEAASSLFLVLDGVQDPHNLGACLRSAEAAGVTAVIIPKDKSAGVTPVVHKASAGAADRVPLVAVTNLARVLERMKQKGVWITGLAGEADRTIYDMDFHGAIAIVMGGEGQGLRRLTREKCDFLAKIPMVGSIESLNVSVATGIVLFEALRQRQNLPLLKR